jgi:hypothetical protein
MGATVMMVSLILTVGYAVPPMRNWAARSPHAGPQSGDACSPDPALPHPLAQNNQTPEIPPRCYDPYTLMYHYKVRGGLLTAARSRSL